jgi:hypothetical protein
MKTMILSDEVFEQMERALTQTAQGRTVLDQMAEPLPELPPVRELIGLARQKADPPERVRRMREYRDAGRQAATDTREAMTELIEQLYAAGVGGRQISRWTGVGEARVYEIVSPAQASV